MPPVQPSASVAATGLGIRYIGSGAFQHCMAYSGLAASSTTEQTILEFHVGSGYIAGVFTLIGGAKQTTSVTLGNTSVWRIKLNGEIVALIKTETINEDMPSTETISLILSPQTKVTVGLISDQNDGEISNSTTFTGRVYGTE